jgi:hypothetical protein
MSNPSTVWTQLSSPNPSVGSLPFVDVDGATITTDVTHLSYLGPNDTPDVSVQELASQITCTNAMRSGYTDTTAAPGAATVNKTRGRVKFAAGATTLVVTSNCVFANSIINLNLEGAFDVTATRAQVITQAAGSFTISLNAACTAALTVSFSVDTVF